MHYLYCIVIPWDKQVLLFMNCFNSVIKWLFQDVINLINRKCQKPGLEVILMPNIRTVCEDCLKAFLQQVPTFDFIHLLKYYHLALHRASCFCFANVAFKYILLIFKGYFCFHYALYWRSDSGYGFVFFFFLCSALSLIFLYVHFSYF